MSNLWIFGYGFGLGCIWGVLCHHWWLEWSQKRERTRSEKVTALEGWQRSSIADSGTSQRLEEANRECGLGSASVTMSGLSCNVCEKMPSSDPMCPHDRTVLCDGPNDLILKYQARKRQSHSVSESVQVGFEEEEDQHREDTSNYNAMVGRSLKR